MSDKRIDMSAFVGKDFDCEFKLFPEEFKLKIDKLKSIHVGSGSNKDEFEFLSATKHSVPSYRLYDIDDYYHICFPLSQAFQKIDNEIQYPSGVVWLCHCFNYAGNDYFDQIMTSKEINNHSNNSLHRILMIKALGFEKDYAEQAKEWDYPVVEL